MRKRNSQMQDQKIEVAVTEFKAYADPLIQR